MIDEAIERLRNLLKHTTAIDQRAIHLGIEALELYYALRGSTAIDVDDIPSRLPSEPD